MPSPGRRCRNREGIHHLFGELVDRFHQQKSIAGECGLVVSRDDQILIQSGLKVQSNHHAILGYMSHAHFPSFAHRKLINGFASEKDLASIQGVHARDHFHQFGLAVAADPGDGHDLTLMNLKRDMGNGRKSIHVRDADIADFQHDLAALDLLLVYL